MTRFIALAGLLCAIAGAKAAEVGERRFIDPVHPVMLWAGPPAAPGGIPQGAGVPVDSGSLRVIGKTGGFSGGYWVLRDNGKKAWTANDLILTHNAQENAAHEAAKRACARKGGTEIGMTREALYASCWGRPDHINITATAGGTVEQLVYRGGYVYISADRVTGIQVTTR